MQFNVIPGRETTSDKVIQISILQLIIYCFAVHCRHKLPQVEPPRPLLDDLNFGPLAGLLEQRRLAGSSGQYNAGNSYSSQSYGNCLVIFLNSVIPMHYLNSLFPSLCMLQLSRSF